VAASHNVNVAAALFSLEFPFILWHALSRLKSAAVPKSEKPPASAAFVFFGPILAKER
jgi:hypothetical protein